MADVESNIHVNIDTSDALASLKLLQNQISAFHTQMAKSGAAASAVSANQAQNLMNSINATGKFQASMQTVTSSTEHFTNALEKNKLSAGEYFRYTGAATKTFGRLFASEFDTISKVARERVKDIQTQYIKMGRGANGAIQAISVRPLTLDMKNLGTQTAIAAQKQQLLNQLLNQGSTNLLNFGKNTQWAGRQLMVGFTVPLVMLGAQASKTFMQLEEQAIRFKRVYGDMFTTQAETDAMVKQIQKLALEYTKYGVAVSDTMQMAADAAAMGKQGAALTAQVAEATRLAVLGGVAQADALQTTISLQNAFGISSDKLAGKIDFLNAVENQTVVSISDLTTAIPKAGPVVTQLGGSVEDLTFFLTAMKEGGINASEGANALKSGLAALINPSKKASEMLSGLGINLKGIVQANKGDIKATVIGFGQALDTLDPLARAKAIEQLFGKFQFARLSTLFKNVTAQGTQAQKVLGLTRATTEELAILSQRELDKVSNSTTYRFKKSIEDIKVALAPVGEQFLKALTPIIQFVGKILDKFNNLGDGSKKFLTILTVAIAGIGPVLLMSFGLIANAVANVIKMFVGLKSLFNGTGSASKVLGEQTSYLTKEQLDAAAVAASLDQVHSKLHQTFTSETAAVNTLAQAYRSAIAAQIGFSGPVSGKAANVKGLKKFSTGTAKVPGSGNQDTVPSMLTPGEAVIPQRAAQDPANRPFIAHMVAGGTIQGFNTGTTDVQKDVKVNETHVGGRSKPKPISEVIASNPGMSMDQKLKLISMEQLLKSQGLPAVTTTKHSLMFDFPEWINKAMPTLTGGVPTDQFIAEWQARGPGKWNPSKMTPAEAQVMDDAFLKILQDKKPTFVNDNLIDEIYRTEIPKIVSPNDAGYIKSQKLYATDYRFNMGQGLGTTPESSKAILDSAVEQGLITGYDLKTRTATGKGREGKVVTASATVTLPAGVYHGVNVPEGTVVGMNRMGSGTTPKITQSLKATTEEERAKAQSNQDSADIKTLKEISKEAKKTRSGKLPITDFGTQVSGTSGYSFPVKGIGGVYIKPDGSKVFVKPMIDEMSAVAEQRATKIARDVHGLDSPEQTIRTMSDPKDPTGKRKIIVLESPYDNKFDPAKMSNTFTKEEYFKQLTAANLRGDKDLGRGNLSGNVLADVGTSGVFAKASGKRDYATTMPSMEEQASINLLGVKGGAKKFFAEATLDIPKNMTAEQYDASMKAEIDRVLPKLKNTINELGLNSLERPVYEAMVQRLEEGRKVDWKAFHKLHSSVLVTKNESLLDEKTGNITSIKGAPKPTQAVSSSGNPEDKIITKVPSGKKVVQTPRKPGKFILPGHADAPSVDQITSQARAASSKTMLYGTGQVDAEQKSLRRQIQALEKRSLLAQKVAYQQTIIDQKMVAEAQKLTLSERLKTFTTQRSAAKQARIAEGKNSKIGLGGAVGIASGVAMVGSMVPGTVGDISQKIMMPLMGLSMVMPMLKSPAAALAVGLAATVGSFIALRMAFDGAQRKVLEESEKFRGSATAVQSLAKFGGQVTASEQMDLRRKNSFSMLGPATGKTTYGEAFIQTAEGKSLTQRIAEQNAAGKGNVAAKDLSGQLSSAITSGAMNMAQAKSLAMNAARQAGDMSIGIKVIAQLESLLGPKGENLLNNPLEVRIKMVQENSKNMQTSANNIKTSGLGSYGQKGTQALGIGARAIGAGVIGAAIGSALGPAGTLVGAIIGAGIGTAIGAIGGYFAQRKFTKQAAQLGAAYAVDAKIAMEQNKQMLDSFDLFYQKKIDELTLQGKINEANALQTKYIKERDKLTGAQGKLQADVVKQYNSAGGLQESMMSGMKKATTAKYKDNPDQLAYLDVVNTQAANLRKSGGINSGQEFLIQAKMASGDIPPAVFRSLLQMATDNKDIAPKMMNIITKFSGATSESIGVAAQNILDAKGTIDKTIQTKFVTKVEAFEKDSDALDFTKNIIKLNNLNAVIPSNVLVNYYVDPKNKTVYDQLNKMLDAIDSNKVLTKDIVYSIIPNIKGTGAFDEAYFATLTEDQKKVYTTTIASVINIPDPVILASPDYIAWTKETGPHGGADVTGSVANKIAKYKEAQGWKAVTDNTQINTNVPTGANAGSTPAAIKASPLDDLVKKLRDVRMNQIKVTEGFSASRKALDNLFGGKKTIDVFSGIENDIRKLGGGEDLISLIVGMDPKEYEKQKNSLFKFDNKGNIIAFKEDAKNIQEALNSITMGDWNSSMEADLKNITNQTTALDKLSKLGVPVANAYDLISNKAYASAIAKGADAKSMAALIAKYTALTAAQKQYQAVQNIKTDIAQTKATNAQDERLSSQYGAYDVSAIRSDTNLKLMEEAISAAQSDIKNKIKIGAPLSILTTAQNNLNSLISDFNTRLSQVKETISFMQGVFDQGFSNVNQAFSVQEQTLQLKFNADTKDANKTITDAQNLIAGKQYNIDDKQAALQGIADKEQIINDKYDARITALDAVEKINASIADQQRGQLTLAEALSSGDIAAAAKAAQDIRAKEAADAVTKQKDALEKSRQNELSQLTAYDPTSKTYKTRAQLELDIKNIEAEIFKIEQDKVRPAQEFIRLKEIDLKTATDGLTVLGKTRDQWEAIKNQVDNALISSKQFIESMSMAMDSYGKLIAMYKAQPASSNTTFFPSGANPPVPEPTPTPTPTPQNTGNGADAKYDAKTVATKAAAEAARAGILSTVVPTIQAMQKAGNTDAAEAATVTLMKNLAAVAPTIPLTSAQIVSARKQSLGYLSSGGLVPKYFGAGGFAKGTDTVPAMLTPGEFVMSKYTVDSHGIDAMKSINNGNEIGGTVYNNTYTLTVNAKTNANPNEIAQAVMSTIKQVDDRRVRGVVLNGR